MKTEATQMDALVLAAGRGERLRPLTDEVPKPLIRVGEMTLIDRHLYRLREQGFSKVVVNLCWLGDRIREHVGDGSRYGLRVRYSPEPAGALETGGGILQALPLLDTDPFVVVNGDVLCDFPPGSLELPEDADLNLVMVPNPEHNSDGDFVVRDGRLCHPGEGGGPTCTYSGIGCFRKSLFNDLEPGRFPLGPVIRATIDRSRAAARLYRGYWLDVGSPGRLRQARARAAAGG